MKFVNKVVMDIGSTMSSILVVIGDRLGLWKAMAAHSPITPSELAKRTETAERYIREWLDAQASAGYVSYDPATRRYALPPEQAVALADESSPAFMPGLFEVAAACWAATDKTTHHFRNGHGLAWGDQHPCLFQGTERFFRSSYIGNLVSAWIPALDGVDAKLRKGARVADVGCGVGASTILMAKAFPSRASRLRFARRFGRARAEARAGGRRRRPRAVRSRQVHRLPRSRLRPDRQLRLSPRHGRSQGRRAPRARDDRQGRHLDDRRAVRERSARAEPQPGRSRVLFGLDHVVRSALARVRRPRARRAGRRSAPARRDRRRRLQEHPARDRDPFNIVLEVKA